MTMMSDEPVQPGELETQEVETQGVETQGDEAAFREQLARSTGWKPEEEWVGKPPPRGFMTADQWIEVQDRRNDRIDNLVPKVQEQLEVADSRIRQLEAELAAAQTRRIDDEMDIAVRAGDNDAVKKLLAERDKTRAPQPQEQPPMANPAWNAWAAENGDWYFKESPNYDPAKAAYADTLPQELAAGGFQEGSPAFFNEISRRVNERYKPAIKTDPRVEGARSTSAKPKKKGVQGWNDLPAEKQSDPAFQSIARRFGKGDTDKEKMDQYARVWATTNGES